MFLNKILTSPMCIRGVMKISYFILFYQIHLVAVASYLSSQKYIHYNLIWPLLYHCLKHLWMFTNVICSISFTAITPSKILLSTILSLVAQKSGEGGLDLGRSVTQCLAINLCRQGRESRNTAVVDKPTSMHILHRMSVSNYRFTAPQVSKNNVLDL